jgi:hypothetical protein
MAEKGRMATCYLGSWYREALDKAHEKRGWLHSQYVKVAVLEKLLADGMISERELEKELAKIERRKRVPHGNSKRAKGLAEKKENVLVRAPESAHERTGDRKARLAARISARRSRRQSAV